MKKTLQYLSLFVVLITLPLLVIFVQFRQDIRQRAAETVTAYILPSSVTAAPGDPYSVDIVVKTDTLLINGIDVNFTYPSIKLAVKDINVKNSAFSQEVEHIGNSGLIHLSRATTNPVNGTLYVATVYFTVKEPITSPEFHPAPGSNVIKATDNSEVLIGTQIIAPGDKSYTVLKGGVETEENFFDGILSIFTGR
jgi:hypothetical protein